MNKNLIVIMNYKKAYLEALEKAKESLKDGGISQNSIDYIQSIFPELKEREDEKIRKALYKAIWTYIPTEEGQEYIAWLEKQGEQKSTQGIEPFEAEHGKYYYCIKDYFCGGRKQASKGDVIQALRGLPIMGLKDASEYFLPVNFIKCKSAWREKDENFFANICSIIDADRNFTESAKRRCKNWIKSLKQRMDEK